MYIYQQLLGHLKYIINEFKFFNVVNLYYKLLQEENTCSEVYYNQKNKEKHWGDRE